MSLLLLFKRLRSGLKVPFLATKRRQPRPRDIDTEPTERSWGRWTNPGHVHPIGPGARGVKAAPSGGGQPPKQPSPAPKPAKAPANPQKGGAKPAPAPRPAKAPTETPKGQEPAPAPTPARSKLSQRKLPKPPKVKPPTMAAEPAPKPPPAPKPIPEAVPEAEAGYMGGEDEHGSSAEAPSSHQAVAASYLRPTEEPEEPLNQPVGNEPATRVGVHVPSGERHPSTKPVDVHLPKEEAERQVARAHRDKGPGAEETPGETEPYKEVIDEIVDAMRQRFQYNRHGIGSEESAWGNAVLHGEARGRQLLRDAGATPDEIEPILRRALDRAWDNRAQEETRGEKIQPRQVRAMIKDKAWPMLKDYLLENVEGISTLSAEETNRRVNQAVNLIQYGDRPQEAIDRLKRQLAGTEPALTEAEEEVVRQSYAQMDRIIEDAVRNRAQGWNTRDPDYFLHPQNMRTLVRMYLRQSGMTGEQATPDLVNRLAREAMSRIEPVSEENVFLAPAREDDEEESGATPLDQIDLSQYNLSPEDEEKVRSIIPGLTSFAQMIVNSYNEHHGTNRYPGYDQPTSYDHLESEMYRLFQYVGQELRYRGVNRPRVGFGQDDLVNELIDIATDRIKLAPARGDEELKQVETPQTGQSKLQDFRDAAEMAEALRQWQEKEPPAPPPDASHEEAEAWAAELRRWEQEKPKKQDQTPEDKKFVEKLKRNQRAHELTSKVAKAQLSTTERLQLEKQMDDLVAQWEPKAELGWDSIGPDTEKDDPIQKQIDELGKILDDKSSLAHKVLRESLKDTAAAWQAGYNFDKQIDPENKGEELIERGVDFVSGMVAAPGIRKHRLLVNTLAKKGRPQYDGVIHINPSKKHPSDWVHEFGHHLEQHVPGLNKIAQDFLRHRVGDEEPVSLKKLFPRRGFKDDETGREDDFGKVFGKEAHYVGKEYSDGQTEIISMGLEKMYSDPVGFAQMDPEYFAFMVGVMDGSLLKEAEPEEINPGQGTPQAPAQEKPRDVKVEFKNITAEESFKRVAIDFDHPGKYVGAPDGSSVTVQQDPYKDGVTIRLKGDGYSASRYFFTGMEGRLICDNTSFNIDKEKQGKGLGAQIFADQVRALQEAGFSHILTVAKGKPDDPDYNGYYTWPRLGYDGIIPQSLVRKMPPDLKQSNPQTIQDLFALPNGMQWWKENGKTINLKFDLKPGSRSLKVLETYLKYKGMSHGGGNRPEPGGGSGTGQGMGGTAPQAPARGDEVTADDLSDWIG